MTDTHEDSVLMVCPLCEGRSLHDKAQVALIRALFCPDCGCELVPMERILAEQREQASAGLEVFGS